MSALFTLKKLFFLKNKDRFKEMKKIEYMAPEMEILRLSMNATILQISTGAGDPVIHTGDDNVPGDDDPVIDD